MKRLLILAFALCAGMAHAKDWPTIPQIQEVYQEDIVNILKAPDRESLIAILADHRRTVECLGQSTNMDKEAMSVAILEVENKMFSNSAITETYRKSMKRVENVDYFWHPDEKSCNRIRERFSK